MLHGLKQQSSLDEGKTPWHKGGSKKSGDASSGVLGLQARRRWGVSIGDTVLWSRFKCAKTR